MNPERLGGLLPLEPPPAPGADPWLLIWWALALLGLLLAVLWWWRRPATRRLRRLRQLQRRIAHAGADLHGLSGQLEALLHDALGNRPLDRQSPPRGMDAARWAELLDTLYQARFSGQAVAPETLASLLPDIRRLLRQGHGLA